MDTAPLFDQPLTTSTPEAPSSDTEAASRSGFKKTKVGWIPEAWEVKRMTEIVDSVSAGRSVGGKDANIKDGEKGVLRTSAVTSGLFVPAEHKVVDPEDHERLKLSPRSGDILFNRANGSLDLVGISVRVKKDRPNLFLSDKLWRIQPGSDTSGQWLHYALKSERAIDYIRTYAGQKSTGMKNIAQRDFLTIPIPVPPRPEQRRIAGVLSTWDRALQQIDDLIAAKERRKKALMQQLLTGQTRLPGFGGAPWHKQQIGDHFEYFSNRNKGDKDLTILSCSKVYGIVPQADRFDKRIASKDISNYKIVEQGDLIYDPMLLWDGSIGFLNAVEKGVVSPAYYTFHFQGDALDQQFFSYLFQSHYMKYQYGAISQGTNARRKKAPRGAFLDIEVHLPQKEERHAIANILSTCDAELELLRTEREALQKQKKGMMQKLLTGAVRVPADHPVESTPNPTA